jgi:hypothetical protein
MLMQHFMTRIYAAALAVLLASSAMAQTSRPNIVFIFTDDHAAHAMSCYGSKINDTPTLDRIANQGMIFTHCFSTKSMNQHQGFAAARYKIPANGILEGDEFFSHCYKITGQSKIRNVGNQDYHILGWQDSNPRPLPLKGNVYLNYAASQNNSEQKSVFFA